jgi:predicted flap endonuclease-1-like 5' DNA nuclease
MASLESIEGIGAVQARKLRAVGVRGTVSLLERGATRKGRAELAKETGVSDKLVLAWCNKADLMRVKGVGEEYSDLLEQAGVDTVAELKGRNPANLHKAMIEKNDAGKRHLVRRTPSLGEVERWVAHAKTLPRVMTY